MQGTNTPVDIPADHEFYIVGRGHVFTCPVDLVPMNVDLLEDAEPHTYTFNGMSTAHADDWSGPVIHKIQKFKRNGREMVAMLVNFPGW